MFFYRKLVYVFLSNLVGGHTDFPFNHLLSECCKMPFFAKSWKYTRVMLFCFVFCLVLLFEPKFLVRKIRPLFWPGFLEFSITYFLSVEKSHHYTNVQTISHIFLRFFAVIFTQYTMVQANMAVYRAICKKKQSKYTEIGMGPHSDCSKILLVTFCKKTFLNFDVFDCRKYLNAYANLGFFRQYP